ncbi:Reverse transcriptase (RNA-dependent DNA polymerase) [Aeromonas encheleia]|uniref:reverse transcriptase domain-containing protein n=1 Tax=Aeromonas encheleia TaxID=73010 RepID=UPI000AF57ED2|nr:reverse transcriptase domain-containing protein [Aeromonas encheleia]VEG97310.1 Reverse transcriptase (RNA-dependent DNA polymerase) [Aeromonas encheleia]
MKQLDRKYYNLKPIHSNLYDHYILGLAWKKSDGFVRNYNWYADLLSLDKYTLIIDSAIKSWSNKISNGHFTSVKLNLIPAPKSAKWTIKNGEWTLNDSERTLRPLADISIRDQTIATTVLMCLADALESRQKNCSLSEQDYSEHIKNKVVSYGNRLLCDWEGEVARFRWGGSEFYRKYSSDYRSFLQRPISIGRKIREQVSTADEVYIIHLDLKNFYGSIKLELLIKKLEEIVTTHYKDLEDEAYVYDDVFWKKTLDLFQWSWTDESKKISDELNFSGPIGLPQGLASSGALSNAYLIRFDEKIINNLRQKINDSEIYIHDYCRYVDDLRFVVSGVSLTKEYIKSTIKDFIQHVLDEDLEQSPKDASNKLPYLEVNSQKTQIFELSALDNWSSLTNRVNEIQSEIGSSCIAERHTLDLNIPALQQLLQIDHNDTLQNIEQVFPDLNLGSVIKVDSLHRFSAHRLSSALMSKSKLISPNENFILENEASVVSNKLISTWLKDPSNMVLFRKAIEIHPSTPAYENILEFILNKAINSADIKEVYIMTYLLSDIFRSVTDIYIKLNTFQLNDYNPLFSKTTIAAQKLLSCKSDLPSYIYKQALFYLAVIKKPFISIKRRDKNIAKLHKVIMRQQFNQLRLFDGYLFEIAAQITGDYKANASFLLLHESSSSVLNKILDSYAFRGGKFWNAIWNELLNNNNEELIAKYRWASPKINLSPNGNSHYLSTIAAFKDNPFKHEHSLLKLGLALIDVVEREKSKFWRKDGYQLSPHELRVEIQSGKSWCDLWKIDTELTCIPDPKEMSLSSYDPRYETPEWLANDNEGYQYERKIYWICSILRGAALGNIDFTQRNNLSYEDDRYSGIRTQWLKRRMGMLQSPESIVGSFGTISDWFTHLLQHGLQWPGFSSSYIEEKEILSISSLNDFKICLKERLDALNSRVCVASNVPTLPTVINRPELSANLFRVVTVQQLFPKEIHFHRSDVTLDNKDVRWKHREHLAEVCKLTEQTLRAKLRVEQKNYKSTADLIVFSELAVHPDDEDIIRGLALRTKSIVFAGFVFSEHNGKVINKARWIIPDKAEFGMQWRVRDQGKLHMTPGEKSLNIEGYRPCQHVIEIEGSPEGPFKITGAICYDATDIKLAADLRDQTDMFVISAYNKDVNTFDNMASALQWHMYQHIIIANTGEYGGSTMQAPYKEKHHKLISHAHGTGQIAISTADIDLAAFRRKVIEYKKTKAEPAGFNRKH